jgi:hypothetical protein
VKWLSVWLPYKKSPINTKKSNAWVSCNPVHSTSHTTNKYICICTNVRLSMENIVNIVICLKSL